jgi:hypothetical protein
MAVWNGTRVNQLHSSPTATVASDRIFSSVNEESVATKSSSGPDQIFRGDFRPDEIFNASRRNNG